MWESQIWMIDSYDNRSNHFKIQCLFCHKKAHCSYSIKKMVISLTLHFFGSHYITISYNFSEKLLSGSYTFLENKISNFGFVFIVITIWLVSIKLIYFCPIFNKKNSTCWHCVASNIWIGTLIFFKALTVSKPGCFSLFLPELKINRPYKHLFVSLCLMFLYIFPAKNIISESCNFNTPKYMCTFYMGHII